MSPVHRKIFTGIFLLCLVMVGLQCLRSVGYQQTHYLRSSAMSKGLAYLADGKTVEAREEMKPLYAEDTFSGFPGVVIAASYYREYVEGSPGAISDMAYYIKKAHATDRSFATCYYYAAYLYHEREYDQAIELVESARKSITGVTPWAEVIDRRHWQPALTNLQKACELAKKDGFRPKPTLEWRKNETVGKRFKVEFRL